MDALTTQVLDIIYRHASHTYPNECCGFVLADGNVHEGTNIQNEIHAANPATYRRTAANGYTFSVADTVFLNNSFRTRSPVVVIYHSHPDVGAYFSHEDADKALYGGKPVYPVDYLVVDVAAGVARGSRLFSLRKGKFVCTREFDLKLVHTRKGGLKMKTVIFPEVLARAAKLSSNRLTGYGSTIGEVISDICAKHPTLHAHLFYDNRQLKEHFLLTSKGALAGPDSPLSSDDEVEIMLATSGGADASGLSNEEVQRYVRHITLPDVGRKGQLRLKQSKVLVIGTGGLGSPVCLYLAAAGVGTIGLADFDVVESSNLQRQIVHGYSTLGMPKVESAKRRLLDLNPHIEVRTHQCAVDTENAQDLIGQYDLVVDGTDNFSSRYLVNAVCAKQNKPLVFGAINRFDGQVSVFNLNGGPCYQCLFPKSPPPELAPSCNAGGVIGVLPGVIGLLQATEAVKVLVGIGESLAGRLLRFDALRMRFDEVKFGRRSDCPACGLVSSDTPLPRGDDLACQVASTPSQRLEGQRYIDPNDLHQMIARGHEDYALLDVRDANELEVCRLPGVLNIPLSDLDDRIAELDTGRRYIVVCYAGVRAERAAVRLMNAGFDKVKVLDGGMKRWARDVEHDMPMY